VPPDGHPPDAPPDPLPATVAALTRSDLDRRERSRLLARLAVALTGGARRAGGRGLLGGRLLVDAVLQAAPHLPVRPLPVLVEHHGGRTGEALADALVSSAVRASAAVGAAGGALAAAEWTAPPTLLSAPVQLAAETLAVAAVEIKLIAELHEAYGLPVLGTSTERGMAYVAAWAQGRGVDLRHPRPGLTGVVGRAGRRELRDRLLRRAGRNLSTLGPVLTGAVLGAELNRRATRKLADQVRRDLLRQRADRVIGGHPG